MSGPENRLYMKDHYIVCGYGRMGKKIVSELRKNNVPCFVLEPNPEHREELEASGIPFLPASATEDENLIAAGIKEAKGLISVAMTDESNVFIVLTARSLNPDLFVVARSILKRNEGKLRNAGADVVVSPYILGGRSIAAAVIKPDVSDFLDQVLNDEVPDATARKIKISPESKAVGKTVAELDVWRRCGVVLLAIVKDGADICVNPKPGTAVNADDEIVVMGNEENTAAAAEYLK